MKWSRLFAILSVLASAFPAKACQLALALAVDVSGSIDPVEYRFQMHGMADALEDPTIADALVQGQVALTVIQWSGAGEQIITVPWQRMLSPQHVSGIAERVRSATREWSTSKTAIGDLIGFSAQQFGTVPDCARKVVDISGDGMNNDGKETVPQRAFALSQGITINGLAIDRVGRSVTQYFRGHIIAGRDAFVITATGYGDYPRAIERKLFREIVRPGS
jgi:Ca-activated chloride channel homolog